MKFRFLLTFLVFALICGFSTDISAQGLRIGGFKLKKIGASIGQDQDMLGDMSAAYFISTAQSGMLQNDYSQLDLLPSDTYSMICENPHLRLNATWESVAFPKLEFGTNLLLVTGRIDAMDFRSSDGETNLYVNQYSNEIALEPTLGYRLGNGPFNITAIIGGNLGYHWGDLNLNGNVRVCDDSTVKFREEAGANCVAEYIYEDVPTTTGLSTRLFA
ncbi:MAG: hypothetical protein AAF840_05190, partial [Bacteroidota bacterium]